MVTFDPSEGQGGIEGRAMAYTSEMISRRIHVVVAALSPGRRTSEEPYRGTTLVRLSSSILHLPGTFKSFVRITHRSSVDSIFMLSGGCTGAGILILIFSRLTGRRSGVFFYGKDILQARKRPVGKILLTLSILLADGVAANSRYTASLLPVRPRGAPTIIYPGVDSTVADVVDGVAKDPESPRVLFVGRLVRRKGADLLLTAFGQLKPDLPDLRLDIVGDGPELGNLRAQAERLDLGEAVTFHGALFGRQLWKVYAGASLFVMPSRQTEYDMEGFGTVFLEAGVFGIPSVGTRTGGVPEAVIDGVTGRLVNSEDIDALRNTIRTLLADEGEMNRLGMNARERALRLSWGHSTDQVIQLLGGASGGSPPRPETTYPLVS